MQQNPDSFFVPLSHIFSLFSHFSFSFPLTFLNISRVYSFRTLLPPPQGTTAPDIHQERQHSIPGLLLSLYWKGYRVAVWQDITLY